MSVVEGDSEKKKPRPRKKKAKSRPHPKVQRTAEATVRPDTKDLPETEVIDLVRKEAVRALGDNCSEILAGITDKAKKGHVPQARFLCEMAEKKKELAAAQEQRRKRSIAAQWATEPEWKSEPNGLAMESKEENQ